MEKHDLTEIECCVSHIQFDEDDIPGQCRQCRKCMKMIRPKDFDEECPGTVEVTKYAFMPGPVKPGGIISD